MIAIFKYFVPLYLYSCEIRLILNRLYANELIRWLYKFFVMYLVVYHGGGKHVILACNCTQNSLQGRG